MSSLPDPTQPPSIRLSTSAQEMSDRERYVLMNFMNTLGIPYKFTDSRDALLWPESNDKVAVRLEVPSELLDRAFISLARIEESTSMKRDALGRYPFQHDAFAGESGCPVDGILEQVSYSIMRVVAEHGGHWQPQPVWPGGSSFAVCLTHDIDWIRKWHLRSLIGHLGLTGLRLLKGPRRLASWRKLGHDLQSAAKRENPYWNVDEIATREKELGFRSTFFFLADGRHPKDGDYSIQDPAIIRLIKRLQTEGFEVGLHGSYRSFEAPELLEEELARLQSIAGQIWGTRQHYLRFDSQATLEVHESLGLSYDTTMGYAEHEGFRAGFSFPFYPYHHDENRPFKLLEIPLTIMDSTLYQYRRLSAPEGWQAVKHQLELVKQSGGCCTLLWHNTYFDEADYPGYGDIYWRALEWTARNNGWAAPAYEVWHHWTQRVKDTTISATVN